MEKHIKEIALIIDNTRVPDEAYLHDSGEAAAKIMAYVNYHYELKERLNFQVEQLN
jgi:hypothetical protein